MIPGAFEPAQEGLSLFRARSFALNVPGEHTGPGYAVFSATAVGLATEEGNATSVRNHVISRVLSLEPTGPLFEVRLECGVLATVTGEAVRDLRLQAGTTAVLEIKAAAIRPLLRLY